jgi:hypothetical protein
LVTPDTPETVSQKTTHKGCLGLYENRLFKRDFDGNPSISAARRRPDTNCMGMENKIAAAAFPLHVLLTCSERQRGAQQQGRCSAGATFSICQPTRLGIDQTRNRPDRPRPDHYWHPHPADTSALAALQLCNLFVTANRSWKFKSHQLARQQRAGRREVEHYPVGSDTAQHITVLS